MSDETYTETTEPDGNRVIRDAAGNILEIETPDGTRIYVVPPNAEEDEPRATHFTASDD